MRRASFNSESGAILLIVIILMLALTIVGLVFLSVGVMEYRLVRREVQKNQAFWLAEAGLEHFRVKLPPEVDSDSIDEFYEEVLWSDGAEVIERTPLLEEGKYWQEGEYWVNDVSGELSVISTGWVKDREQEILKSIQMTIQLIPFFEFALFGREGVVMDSNIGVINGPVGTNSSEPDTVVMRSNSKIEAEEDVPGTLWVGPGGDQSVLLYESTAPPPAVETLGKVKEFPPKVPSGGPPLYWDPGPPGSYTVDERSLNLDGTQSEIITQSRRYTSISLNSNSILKINPDETLLEPGENMILYVNTGIEVNSNSKIILEGVLGDPGVEIYFGGDLFVDSNAAIDNESDVAPRLKIYGTHDYVDPPQEPAHTVTLDSNIEVFSGALRAPNTMITIHSNADIMGSIIGYKVDVDSNAEISFDPTLPTSGPFVPDLTDWEEVPPQIQ